MATKWPELDPGSLRHQIRIMQQVVSSGPSGPKEAWVEFGWAWAALNPGAFHVAREIADSGQMLSEVPIAVTIRYEPGIQAKMRIEVQGDTYIIEDIINDQGMNVSLVLLCRSLRNAL